MLRKILAIIVSYVIFAGSAIILFQLSGQKAHGDVPLNFQILTGVYGIAFSLLSGFVLGFIARSKDLKLNYILAVIIAAFALVSLLTASGTKWSQLIAIFLFAPASILGGILFKKFKNK